MEVIIAYTSFLAGIILVLMTIYWDWLYLQIQKIIQPYTTVRIFIGGLIPHQTNVTIYDKYNTNDAEVIVSNNSDENGEFHYRLSRRYIGKRLRVPIMQTGFEYNHQEEIIIQPWGYFEAVKMVFDRNDNYGNRLTGMANNYKNTKFANEKYNEALYRSQYIARNQINNTKWFFMAAGVSVVVSLIGLGVVWWVGIIIAVAGWAIRAFMNNRALGLSVKPMN